MSFDLVVMRIQAHRHCMSLFQMKCYGSLLNVKLLPNYLSRLYLEILRNLPIEYYELKVCSITTHRHVLLLYCQNDKDSDSHKFLKVFECEFYR